MQKQNALKETVYECDLCVVGGGLSGLAAAVAAAREGLSVVLMHERPVLGGNASSEIRMCVCGAHGDNNRETGIVEELMLKNLYRNPRRSYPIWDTTVHELAIDEKNIKLLLNCTCMDADIEEGEFEHGRTVKINSVKGYQMTTQKMITVKAKYFCDSSGDSILAPLTGAEFRMGREAASEFGEDTEVAVADDMTMGSSCLIYGEEVDDDVKFIPPAWYNKFDRSFADRRYYGIEKGESFWYLELGGNRNTIDDAEEIRDDLLALAMGMWNYVKNTQEGNEKWELDFMNFLPGKRESRRMCGEYILNSKDIIDNKVFEDEIAFGGWGIDDHYPGGFFHIGKANKAFKTPAPHSLPYRSLYSKNVDNLFFAGRNISATHMAMSNTRVMATCALLGEAVGKAAAVANRYNLAPHGVYLERMEEVQDLLMAEDCFLPNKKRKISDVCKKAEIIGADDSIRNGEDRAHEIYGNKGEVAGAMVKLGDKIEYNLGGETVGTVHIVFNSDLNRETLAGTTTERRLVYCASRPKGRPQQYMPKTLCKAFRLVGFVGDEEIEILNVTDNIKRSYNIKVDKKFDKLALIPTEIWSDAEEVNIISFDF